MADFFIKRPILSICLSIIIVLLGTFSILRLPISEYPDIIPPSIQVTATYPGADCETVVKSIASPIEQQMSGVDGMSYMTSVNTNNGQMSMMILFEIGTEANMDQVLSYLRYGQATSQLPPEVSELGVSLRKTSGLPALVVSLYSPQGTYDGLWLANYAYINMVDAIKRVPGVGDVQVFGSGRYAMRIWLNPEKMAALNITARDVMLAVQAQNAVNPAGKIGAQPAPPDQQLSFTVKAPGRLTSVKEFENIVVRGQGSSIVRVGDVARVELGSETYSLSSSVNGMPAASIGIYEAPGGNAIQLVDNIKALLNDTEMPPGMDYLVSLDSTLAVRAGIEDIVSTLVIALGLVVLVVFIFLQGWRGTLIPAFAVPVSIVGAFIAFPFFGFSINTICLMGLVLAIGLVVDDAIVVVEAVESHMERGLTPRQAAFAAMEEVSGPVIAIALVLAAVFLPSLLLPGITGTLFQQFAVTIAISMLISAFNALTLSPALSAILLKPKDPNKGGPLKFFYRIFNRGYDATASGYTKVCHFLTRKLIISIPLLALIAYAILPVAKQIPNGFLPDEDQGYLFSALIMPEARSLQLTTAAADKVSDLIRQNPNVKDVIAISGFSLLTGVQSTNNAFFFVMLKPWEERPNPDQSAKAVTAQLNALLSTKVPEGIPMCFQPPAIAGVGSANGVTFMLEDRDGKGTEYLAEQTDIFVKEASKLPIFDPQKNGGVRSVMSFAVEQKDVRLDEEKCATLGVSISEANSLLQAYMGSLFINYITLYGQQWQVYIQAQGSDRTGTDMLKNFYVKNDSGSSVPLSTLVKITDIKGPEFLLRQNLYNSSKLMVTPAQGYSNSRPWKRWNRPLRPACPRTWATATQT